MPHLSPMNWLTMLLTFWISLMFISSIIWWSQTPKWYTSNLVNKKKSHKSWQWL